MRLECIATSETTTQPEHEVGGTSLSCLPVFPQGPVMVDHILATGAGFHDCLVTTLPLRVLSRNYRVFKVSILGIVSMILGRCLIVGYLNPQSSSQRDMKHGHMIIYAGSPCSEGLAGWRIAMFQLSGLHSPPKAIVAAPYMETLRALRRVL